MLCHVKFIALDISNDFNTFIFRVNQPQQLRLLDPADEGVTVT
jgi:hypothetical protein